MKKTIIVIIYLGFLYSHSYASNIKVSGSINSNTIWSVDTIKVVGNINVPYQTVLTINPGVRVEFQGHFDITCSGVIKAIGNEKDSIYFSINDTTGFYNIESKNGGWHGLRFFNSGGDASMLTYCVLKNAKGTDGQAGYTTNDMGGAIYCTYSNLIISNCLIENNCSVGTGAICFERNSALNKNVVMHNTIKNNRSLNDGAGVYSYFSSPLILENKIIENYVIGDVDGGGGGILSTGSNPIIINNIICNNRALRVGGGIVIMYGSNAKIINNIICNNSASYYGGILISTSTAMLTNNTICNNLANNYGGGLGITESTVEMYNSILWGNVATYGKQIANWTVNTTYNIYNCDIDGALEGFFVSSGQFTGKYLNNINSNPNFVKSTTTAGYNKETSSTDWSLLNNSPCINSGFIDTIGLMLPAKDIYGNERFNDIKVDIGATEYKLLNYILYSKLNYVFELSPNPAKDVLKITLNESINEPTTAKIVNSLGKTVFVQKLENQEQLVSLKNIPSGIYLLQIEKGNQKESVKFIKQ